jgi:hypothetical protein
MSVTGAAAAAAAQPLLSADLLHAMPHVHGVTEHECVISLDSSSSAATSAAAPPSTSASDSVSGVAPPAAVSTSAHHSAASAAPAPHPNAPPAAPERRARLSVFVLSSVLFFLVFE